MFIYIKCGEDFKFSSDIKLKEGYEPLIGKVRLGKELQIEPAIWFKVYVVDTLWIDCFHREIRWSRMKLKPNKTTASEKGESGFYDAGLQESISEQGLHEDGEIYDYDSTIDELFDEMRMLISTYSTKLVTQKSFYQSLLRLLHCYLLPKIILTRDDEELLKSSIEIVDKHITDSEKAMCSTSNHMTLIKNSLLSQRQRFIEHLQRDENVRSYSVTFLETLLGHIKSDIGETVESLSDSQEDVNRLRDSGCDYVDLTDLRLRRDSIHRKNQSLINVRENIQNMALRTKKKHVSKRQSRKSSLAIADTPEDRYLLVCTLLIQREEELALLCERKLKIVSVKEAIKSAIHDLQADDETLGFELGIQKATDVLQNITKPETWITLEERVMLMMNRKNSKFCRHHVNFCEFFHDSVSAFIDEQACFGPEVTIENVYKDSVFYSTVGATNEARCEYRDSTKCGPDVNAPGALKSHGEKLHTVPKRWISRGDKTDADTISRDERKSELFTPLLDCMGKLAQLRRTRGTSLGRCDNEWQLLAYPIKQRIEQLRDSIFKHIEAVMVIIQEELNSPMIHHYNKLWICYENHLYPCIMDDLVLLYRYSYKSICGTLNRVPGLLPQDLDVTDPWIVKLFNDAGTMKKSVRHIAESAGSSIKRLLSRRQSLDASKPQTKAAEKKSQTDLSFKDISALYRFADVECEAMGDLTSEVSVFDVNLIYDVRRRSVRRSSSDPTIHDKMSNPVSDVNYNLLKPPERVSGVLFLPEPGSQNVTYRTGEKANSNFVKSTKFNELFVPVLKKIETISREKTVLGKLKQLTKAFRMISKRVSSLHDKGDYLACCDDMLTVCIVLMTNLTAERLYALYTDVNMMIDLMAPCLRGGMHDCTLMNFQGAFQYIMDFLMLKDRREVTLRSK